VPATGRQDAIPFAGRKRADAAPPCPDVAQGLASLMREFRFKLRSLAFYSKQAKVLFKF
jgi:hypothetical protein